MAPADGLEVDHWHRHLQQHHRYNHYIPPHHHHHHDGLQVDGKDDEGELPRKRRRTLLPSSRQVHVLPIVEEVKMEVKEEGEDNMEVKDEHTVEVEFGQEVKEEVKLEFKIKKEDVYGVKKEEAAEALLKMEGKGLAGEFWEESKVLKVERKEELEKLKAEVEEKSLLDASSSSNLLLSSSFAELEVELGAEVELGVELGAEVELGLDGDQEDAANLFRPYLI